MGSIGDLFVRLGLDVSQFQGNMGLARQSLTGMSTAVNALRASFAVSIFASAFSVLGGFSAKAAEAEQTTARLSQAIENTGSTLERYSQQIDTAVDRGRRFGFSGDQQRQALALLVTQTGSVEEALKRLSVAYDLARVTQQDLYSSARLLGKASDENVTALNRVGISVRRGATEEEFFADVIRKVGGQAEAQSGTVRVLADRITNSFGQAVEKVGTQINGIAPTIGALSIAFNQLGLQGIVASGGIGALTGALTGMATSAGLAARAVGGFLLALAPLAAVAAIGVAVAAGLAKIGQALDIPILREAGETLDMIGQIIERVGVGGLLDRLAEGLFGIGRAAESTETPIDSAGDALRRFSQQYDDTMERLKSAGGFPGGGAFKQIEDVMRAFARDVPNLTQSLSQIEDTLAGIRGLGQIEATQAIGTAIRQNLTRVVNAEVENMESLRDGAKREMEAVARFWADEADRRADFARTMAERARPVMETIDQLNKDLGAGFDAARRAAQAEAVRSRFAAETAELERREAERIARLRPPETPTLTKVVEQFGSLEALDAQIAGMRDRNQQVFTLLDQLISGVVDSQRKAIQEMEEARQILLHPEIVGEARRGAIPEGTIARDLDRSDRMLGVPGRFASMVQTPEERLRGQALARQLNVDVKIDAPDLLVQNMTPDAMERIARSAFEKIAAGAEVIVRQMSGSAHGDAMITP